MSKKNEDGEDGEDGVERAIAREIASGNPFLMANGLLNLFRLNWAEAAEAWTRGAEDWRRHAPRQTPPSKPSTPSGEVVAFKRPPLYWEPSQRARVELKL